MRGKSNGKDSKGRTTVPKGEGEQKGSKPELKNQTPEEKAKKELDELKKQGKKAPLALSDLQLSIVLDLFNIIRN